MAFTTQTHHNAHTYTFTQAAGMRQSMINSDLLLAYNFGKATVSALPVWS